MYATAETTLVQRESIQDLSFETVRAMHLCNLLLVVIAAGTVTAAQQTVLVNSGVLLTG